MHPLLDGGVSAVEGHRPGRKAPGGTRRAPSTLPDAQSLTADELPDGLVSADDVGRVAVYNRAAVRLTGIAAEQALGKHLSDVLPFRDDDGRDWWMCVDPYHGL